MTWSQVALERERRIASHLEAADRAVEVARVRAEYDVAASSLSKVLTRSLMMTEFERSCGTLRGMAKLPGTIIGSRTTRFSDGSWEQVFDREPRRHVGRCKKPSGCGKGYSAIVLAEVQTRSASYFDTDHGRLQQGRSSGYPIVMCSCGRFVTLHPVLGKYNPDKVCSAKCMSATGPSCECSCAGKNHGSSYG